MKNLKYKLSKLGYKLTVPRVLVLDNLLCLKKPISARNLHKKIKRIDLASVYRTLNLLEELDLVNIELIEKEKLYCLTDTPHHHVICKKCGYMEEMECKHNFNKFKNFTNIHHQLTLTGLCKNCV